MSRLFPLLILAALLLTALAPQLSWASGTKHPAELSFTKVLDDETLGATPDLNSFEVSWVELRTNISKAKPLGLDIQVVGELNFSAQALWFDWMACENQDVRQLRRDYISGKYCTVNVSRADDLKKRISLLREQLISYLGSSLIAEGQIDPGYQLPEQLGSFNPLLTQLLFETVAAQPVFIADFKNSASMNFEVYEQPGISIMVGSWPLRNALLLLSMIPQPDAASWGLFPRFQSSLINSLAVSPVLDQVKVATPRDGFRTGVGDVRELILFRVPQKVFKTCGAMSSDDLGIADPVFQHSSDILELYRSLSKRN